MSSTSSTTSTTGTTGTGAINFTGLTSGIQWGDIVDATIKADEARTVTPITTQITKGTAQKDAWNSLKGLVDTLNTAALAVRRTGFGGYTATIPPSPSTSRTLLTATPSLNAIPGRYRMEVLQLADTAKVAGAAAADTTAAMGLTGDFTLNGANIAIASTDSLNDIRDKINAANTGGTPTGVSATIVSEGGTAGRLVLTKDSSGSAGISLTDGTGGMARSLGFIDSRSKPVSSTQLSAAMALGLSVSPPPATIRVGSVVITADLSVDSIASIVAKINAAGGSASVESEPYGNETRYRLVADGNVSAVNGDPNSQAVIDALGITAGTTGTVHQSVQSGVYTDGANATATSATLLAGLKVDGAATGLAVGDAINIRGLRGDGTAVTIGLVVGATDTMQTLLDKINDATSGFGSGARSAVAALGDDGRIRLTDSQGGASRLSISLGVTHVDGSAGTLGATSVAVSGRSRELQQGKDAIIRVDGREITRSSNSIIDALPNVTLNLLNAEAGTTVDLTIARDVDGAVNSVQKLVDAYNAVRSFYDDQRKTDSPLYADTLLRGVVDTFTSALRTDVTGNTSYNKATLAGVTLDRYGKLSLDASKFKTALADKPTEIEALFGFSGIGDAFVKATDKATQYGIGTISSQVNSIDQRAVRLKQRQTDAQARLEAKRARLVQQYTDMETAISKLQQQSGSLTASIKGLQGTTG